MNTITFEIFGFYLDVPFLIFYLLLFGVLAVLLRFFFKLFWDFVWLPWRQKKYLAKQKFCLLHLLMPRINEQGPEATETIFNALAAAQKGGSWRERNLLGYFQQSVSFEIVSFGSDIHYFVFTPLQYRDLIEAGVYAAYPDVEIHEIEDYAERVNFKFPAEAHELWGTSFVFYNKAPYPIRTYKLFEHSILDPKRVKDPLENMIETMSKLKDGEEMWFQLVITPISSSWTKEGEKLIKEVAKKAMIAEGKGGQWTLWQEFQRQVFATGGGGEEKEGYVPIPRGTQNILELIQSKLSKAGFKVVLRMAYFAPKDVFSMARGVSGFLGALAGYNTLDLNGFKPNGNTKTSGPEYYLVKKRQAQRKNLTLKRYKTRGKFTPAGLSVDSMVNAEKPCILNSEELASLYHFPYTAERVEAIKGISSRRGRPPANLPVE